MRHLHADREDDTARGIMLVELRPEMLFQAGKTMTAIAAQIGPGNAADMDAVAPISQRDFPGRVAIGGGNSAAMKAPIVIGSLVCQCIPQSQQNFSIGRSGFHRAGVEPLQSSEQGWWPCRVPMIIALWCCQLWLAAAVQEA